MRRLSNLVGVLALIWLAGCTPAVMVNHDYDRSVNFRKYSTYRIEPARADEKDPVLNSQLNQQRIEEALKAELKSRGYTNTDQNPELVVRYFTDVQNVQETQGGNNMGYWGWWGRPNNTYTRNYRQARLIVNMVDAASNKLVWQGWAEGEENKSRRQDRDAAVRMLISRIMEQYPHRASSSYNQDATSRR